RVFGPVTCVEAEGWKDANTVLLNFDDDVKTTVHCVDVCTPSLIDPYTALKDEDTINSYTGANSKVECKPNHRLIFNEVERNLMTCSREGWREEGAITKVIDFKDENLSLTDPIKAHCRHKCHQFFIKQACDKAASPTCSD
ncbi:hypothetical protein PFISCL1PPCAC_17290, partial [Pristionchus fissidentatus]